MTRVLTVRDRAEAYAVTFPEWPASHAWIVQEDGHDVLYARWVIGAAWGNNSGYYGAFPATFLDRALALFPDVQSSPHVARQTMHLFAGSMPPGPYVRVDVNPFLEPDVVCEAERLDDAFPFPRFFDLVIADPPYSAADAAEYNTRMIDRGEVMQSLALVTGLGGHVIWLDTCWPMHRKDQWRTVGRIALTRSTNHRTRDVTIFERVAA